MVSINSISNTHRYTMTEVVKYVTIGLLVLFSAVQLREGYFAAVCLRNALRDRKNGVTKRNYLRREMPDNDIENQIQDEIRINTLFLTGIVLWLISLLAFPKSLLVPYVIYSMIAFSFTTKVLEGRYLAFYNLFKTKTCREDFSDELVIYGLRIEGTLTKLKKSRAYSVVYLVAGILLLVM